MMTTTAKKTSLENQHLCNCDYIVITPTCSHSTMSANYVTAESVSAPLN